MKTDSLFYRLFQTAPAILLQLVGRPAEEAANYTFRSVELKQTAFRIDGILVPNTELGHLIFHGDKAEAYAADSARKRDGLSWEKWAKRVQEYLNHVEFILGPDLIILGGGVSRPKKHQKFLHLLKTQADLLPAQLQNEAGIIGAASAARVLADSSEARRA